MAEYREVEWLGGPLDGTKIMIRADLQSVKYPRTVDVLQTGKQVVEPNVQTMNVPVKRGFDNKEYLMWHEATL